MSSHRIRSTTDHALREYIRKHDEESQAFMDEKSIISYYKLGLENKKAYQSGMTFDETIRFLLHQLGEDVNVEIIQRNRKKA
jgi:hypothetical protein